MKSLSLLILTIPFIIPCYCPGQSVTSVALSAGSPSHGSANITFSYSGAPSSFRFRLAQAPATCTGGTGGYVVGSTSSNYQIRNNPQQANVGGLTSSTTYQVCPEITSDGNTWFGGKGVTFTTLPLPNPHPAAPVAPVSFNTNYPDTTGYQVYNLNSACVDSATGNSLQQDILTALANQVTSGAVINIAAGAVCRGQIYLSQLAADLITVQSSSVCPASGTSCTPNSINVAHNFVEGDIAVFGVFADQIGGGAGLPTGILRGQNYYVHVLDSTHFQLTFALPYSMGGSIVPIQDQGFRNFYYYRRFNVVPGVTYGQRALHWIIIRPSTPDNQFVPEHTRLEGPLDASGHPTPPTNWLAKMYTLTMANKYDGFAADNMLFSVSDGDGNFMSMNGYIRIVGAHFTFDPSADSAGGKPMAHYRLFNSNPWNSDIIIDRSWFNPPAAPDENSGLIGFDGTNMAMVDSYSNNFKYYHATYSGMGVSIASANSISIGAGTYNFGSGKVTFPSPVTCTTTGTISVANDAYIYFTAATKTLVITLPPGISGRSCTGYSPYQFVTLSNLGNGLYNSSHGFPNATGGTPALYWVDPIYSVDGTQANQQSLWMNNPEPNSDPNRLAGIQFFGSAAELGTRFQMTANGSIIGVRFWKDPRDVGTHTGTLWSDSGTLLATGTFSNETASGWQTLYFSSPVSVTSGLFYRISYFAPTGCTFNDYFYRNGAMFNGNVPMIAPGLASATTNSWDWTARWPAYWTARPNVGYLGAFAYQNIGTGTITAVANADVYDDSINTEGCQCVLAGNGPGPFVVKDNYFEGSGNIWHFDDGGGFDLSRHDYTVYRNWFYSPLSQMFTTDGMNAASDGMQYGHRHGLEWKQGNCGAIIGNIFDTSWVESTPFGDLFEISGINGAPGVCGVSN
ncbi:MAG TPA: DUF4082 domain-containing protein, partial [Bryobacteraceae bacterium]|nr:DUF4082 domain-containing protein [Bryobacteraceae bacterium]